MLIINADIMRIKVTEKIYYWKIFGLGKIL